MKILLFGGSNSVISGGYSDQLMATLQSKVVSLTVKKLTVGGTTTLSSIGRLYETFACERFDYILYEYTINDTGSFDHRPQGMQSYFLCLELLLCAAANLYPSAILVPILFAEERHFPLSAPNSIYDAQIAAFSALNVPYIDIRRRIFDYFQGSKPAWLYKNATHYSYPAASSLIAEMISEHLLTLRAVDPVSATYNLFCRSNICRKVKPVYVPALTFLQHIKEGAAAHEIENRLMHLKYMRMQAGTQLTIKCDLFPLAIYLKSDLQHHIAHLSLSSPSSQPPIALQTFFSTCHSDSTEHRFIYSSIPVPLLFSTLLAWNFTPTEFVLSVPPIATQPEQIALFDGFINNPTEVKENYLDLVGLLFVSGSL